MMKKSLKKVSLLGIVIAVLFAFGGCTPPTFYFKKPEGVEVEKIQLIEYNNPNVLEQEYYIFLIKKHNDENFDESKCTVLEELSGESFESFVAEVAQENVSMWNASKCGPLGQGIRIIYSDGSFFVITWEKDLDSVYHFNGFSSYYKKDGSDGELDSVDPLYYMIIAANYFDTKIG